MKTPFKFLDSYSKDDQEIFFGRDKEIGQLYRMVFQSKLILLYGASGTGKTSIINCGLANRFSDTDWYALYVRRKGNLTESLIAALTAAIKETHPKFKLRKTGIAQIPELIHELFLIYFKPIYFIFDQFEEIFIMGTEAEQREFVDCLKTILGADENCTAIISLREEYLAHLAQMEKEIPAIMEHRMRIETMTEKKVEEVINNTTKKFNIKIEKPEETVPEIIKRVSDPKTGIQLAYLQVYLDRLYQVDAEQQQIAMDEAGFPQDKEKQIVYSPELVESHGELGNVLAHFIDDQVARISRELSDKNAADEDKVWRILKEFVTLEGTKQPLTREDLDHRLSLKNLQPELITAILSEFEKARILRLNDDVYELSHDILAGIIAEKISLAERTIRRVEKLVKERAADYGFTKTFLTKEELNYVEPYVANLILTEQEKIFLNKSKKETRRKRRNRMITAFSIFMAAIIAISFYLYQTAAQNQRLKIAFADAERSAREADSSAARAERSAEKEKLQALMASQARDSAEDSRILAEAEAIKARLAEGKALTSGALAERRLAQANEALRQQEMAIRAQEIAVEQRMRAELAQQEARRKEIKVLNLSLAQNMAFKATQAQASDTINAIMAMLAYQLTSDFEGPSRDPQIYEGLRYAYYNLTKEKNQLNLPQRPISTFFFGGQNMFVLYANGTLTEFNPASDTIVSQNQLFKSRVPVNSAYYNPIEKTLIVGFDDNTVGLYNIKQEPYALASLKSHEGLLRSTAMSSNEKAFATAGRDSTIMLWNLPGNAEKPTQVYHLASRVRAVAFSSNENHLISGSEDGKLMEWNLKDTTKKLAAQRNARLQALATDRKNDVLAAGYSDGYVEFFNLKTLQRYRPQLKYENPVSVGKVGVEAMDINEEANLIAVASADKAIKIFPLIYDDSPERPLYIIDHNRGVTKLQFGPGNRIYALCSDNTIRYWEIDNQVYYNKLCSIIDLNKNEWSSYMGFDFPKTTICNFNSTSK